MFQPLPDYRRKCDLDFTGTTSMTQQSYADECDIHKILKQYQQTGIINHISPNQPLYLDLPDNLDYQSSLNTILEAQEAFMTLPSSVRDHYGNNPERFLEAIVDPAQREYLESVGVFELKKQNAPGGAAEPVQATPPSPAT